MYSNTKEKEKRFQIKEVKTMEIKDMGVLLMAEAIDKWQESSKTTVYKCHTNNLHKPLISKITPTDRMVFISSQTGTKIEMECPDCGYTQEVPSKIYQWYIDNYMTHSIPLGQVVVVDMTKDISNGSTYRVKEFKYEDGTTISKDEGVTGQEDIQLGFIGKLKAIVVGYHRDCDGEPLYIVSDIRVKFNCDKGLKEHLDYKRWSEFLHSGLPESCLKVIEGEFVSLKYDSIFDYLEELGRELASYK